MKNYNLSLQYKSVMSTPINKTLQTEDLKRRISCLKPHFTTPNCDINCSCYRTTIT